MKLTKLILATIVILCVSNVAYSQLDQKTEEVSYNPNAKVDSSKRSIKSSAVGKIGDANIVIDYHSPGLRKRVVWGGVVPYDEVWVTGAHSATSIEFDRPLIIGGKKIEPGKYALFTIVGKSSWTVILNKNWEQHLADDYDEKDDILRIIVEPREQDKSLERLQYFISELAGKKGTIAIGWDKLLLSFPVQAI